MPRNTLTFDAERHLYTLNGEEVPSVTHILAAVNLVTFDHIPRDSRLKALERGRRVHAAIHYQIEGTLDPRSVDPEDQGYLDASQAFLHDAKLEPLLYETRVADPRYRYAGTIDLVGVWDGEYAVVDWKSSLSPTALCCDLQTAAYVEALRQDPPPELVDYKPGSVIRRLGVSLRKNGLYRVTPYRDPRDLRVFQHAAAICWEQRRRRARSAEEDAA